MKLCPYVFSRLETSNYEGRADFLKGLFLPCVPSWFMDEYFSLPREERLEDIWNGKAAQLIRKKMYEGDLSFCNRSACKMPLFTIEEIEEGSSLFAETPISKKNLEAIKRRDPVMPEGPSSMSLTSDFSCNLKCGICRDKIIPNRPTKAAQEEKDFLLANKENVEVLKMSNGGEVFYSSLQRSILKGLNQKEWPRLKRVHIVSNGTLFSESTYNELKPGSAFIKDVNISIDAGTKEVYELMRGPYWEQLLKNLEFLSTLRKKETLDFFAFHAIVIKDNFRDIPNIVALAEKYGADRVLLQPYNDGPDQGHKNYADQAVHQSTHPDHQEFLDLLGRYRLHPLVQTYFNIFGYDNKKTIPRRPTPKAQEKLKDRFPNGFCSAPFTQMFIEQNGDVSLCCQGVGRLGNLATHTLSELWNGETAKKFRADFLTGRPLLCQKKMEELGCHINYDEILDLADLAVEQQRPPRALEITLNGKCNIECVMCETKDDTRSVFQYNNFWSEIVDKVFPDLVQMNIKGGEPFIQRETYQLIEKIKSVNPDCRYRFTTNGQYNFGKKIKDTLSKINVERVSFSIDSSDPGLFSEIRKGGDLHLCHQTMKEMISWCQDKVQSVPVAFSINITLQKKNWRDVPQTFRHYHKEGHSPCLIYVHYPQTFSLSSCSPEEMVEIINFYVQLPEEYDPYMGSFYHALRPLLLLENNIRLKKLKLLWDMRMQHIERRK